MVYLRRVILIAICWLSFSNHAAHAQTFSKDDAQDHAAASDESKQETDYSKPETFIESFDRDDLRPEGKFSLEVGASMLQLHPDFFDNEGYNTSKDNLVNLVGPQLRLGRSFTLSQRFDTSTYIQGQYATASNGSTPFDLNRSSQFLNFQLLQHIAYNFFGVQLDGAYLQFFIGGGLQRTEFKDKYSDDSGSLTNTMKAWGWVAESGFRLNNSETGFFSSLRVSTFKNTTFDLESTGDAHTDLAIRDSAEISTNAQPIQISLGVGSYF